MKGRSPFDPGVRNESAARRRERVNRLHKYSRSSRLRGNATSRRTHPCNEGRSRVAAFERDTSLRIPWVIVFQVGSDARGLFAPLSSSLQSRPGHPAQVSHYRRLCSKKPIRSGCGSPCAARRDRWSPMPWVIGARQTCQRLWEAIPQGYRQGHCFTDFLKIYATVIAFRAAHCCGQRDRRNGPCGALE